MIEDIKWAGIRMNTNNNLPFWTLMGDAIDDPELSIELQEALEEELKSNGRRD